MKLMDKVAFVGFTILFTTLIVFIYSGEWRRKPIEEVPNQIVWDYPVPDTMAITSISRVDTPMRETWLGPNGVCYTLYNYNSYVTITECDIDSTVLIERDAVKYLVGMRDNNVVSIKSWKR